MPDQEKTISLQIQIVKRLLYDLNSQRLRKWHRASDAGLELTLNEKDPLVKVNLYRSDLGRATTSRVHLEITHGDNRVCIIEPEKKGIFYSLSKYAKEDRELGEAITELYARAFTKVRENDPKEADREKILGATYDLLEDTDPYPRRPQF